RIRRTQSDQGGVCSQCSAAKGGCKIHHSSHCDWRRFLRHGDLTLARGETLNEKTPNIQQPTSNIQWATIRKSLDVGCWLLDVLCRKFRPLFPAHHLTPALSPTSWRRGRWKVAGLFGCFTKSRCFILYVRCWLFDFPLDAFLKNSRIYNDQTHIARPRCRHGQSLRRSQTNRPGRSRRRNHH